jgi:hypothetical protein
MGGPRNLDVARDRYRRCSEELKADSCAVGRTLVRLNTGLWKLALQRIGR